MNTLNIIAYIFYYGSIVTIFLCLIGVIIGLWALLSQRGKDYINKINQRMKNQNSDISGDRDIGAKGG